jgi:hypothetical protein
MVRSWVVAALAASALCGCGGDEARSPAAGEGADEVTYYRDIKPLLDGYCVSCHVEGGVGPHALDSYEAAAPLSRLIASVTEARTMPPFLAAPAVRPYAYDISLRPEQIARFGAWAEGGAAMGDPAQEGAPIEVDQGLLDRVDLSLGMEAAFLPTQSPDHYRCFVLDWPYAADRYVTGFNVRADNVPIVHHAVIYLIDAENAAVVDGADGADGAPGYPCYGSASPEGAASIPTRQFGGWAPGSRGTVYPEGTGVRVSAGARVVLQMHYNVVGQAQARPDQSSVEFRVEEEIEKDGGTLPWLNWDWPTVEGSMHIPAGEAAVIHSYEDDPTQAVLASLFIPGVDASQGLRLHSVYPHMHQLGRDIQASLVRADGEEVPLVHVRAWDFHWQRDYVFAEPVDVMPGDKLKVACLFDNSAQNQPMINGVRGEPAEVNFGEGSYDEMCVAAFYVTALGEPAEGGVDCAAVGSVAAPEGRLAVSFDAVPSVRTSPQLEGELRGAIYGSVFRAEDVGLLGPEDGAEAVASVRFADVDLRGGPSAPLALDVALPAGEYQILGFLDTDQNADPASPEPDLYDPVMIPGAPLALECAQQPVTAWFALLLPRL